jgi:teichuronic acid exporter
VTTSPSQHKSLGKKTTEGVAWSFIRSGGQELLLFPGSMLLARMLTPTEFGIAAAAGFFTVLAGRLSDLGFNAALVRSKVVLPIHLSTVFVVNVLVGMVSFGVLTAIAPFVATFYNTPEVAGILPVAAISFLIVPLGTIPAAILSRDMRFKAETAVDWWHMFSFATVSVLAAWWGASYMSMVYGRLVALTVQAIARIAFVPWRPSFAFSRAALGEILAFGAGVHAKRLLDYIAKNVDNIVVGKFLGMTSLGLYDKAFSTMDRFQGRMTTGGPGVLFRVFAIIHEEPERFRRAYYKVVMSTTMMAFPIFAIVIAVAPQFVVVLFGEVWRPAAVPLQLLCVAGALKLLNSYASAASQAAGQIWPELWRQVLYVVLIVATVFVLRGGGPVGASAGVLLSTIVMTILMNHLLTRVTPLRWPDILKPQVPALVCAAGCAATALLTEQVMRMYVPPVPWVLLAGPGVAAAMFYAVFVLFAPYAALRALVRDVADDLAPTFVKQHPRVRAYLAPFSTSES